MNQPLKTTTQSMKIFVRNNDVDKALRVLKKKLHNEGVMKEVRDRRHFTPPGEEKRLAKKAGRKRWLKKRQQLEQQFVREEEINSERIGRTKMFNDQHKFNSTQKQNTYISQSK